MNNLKIWLYTKFILLDIGLISFRNIFVSQEKVKVKKAGSQL